MKRKMMISAHRGCTEYNNHENTIEAIAKAIEIGCDAVEIDIRITKDNKLILHHDDEVLSNKLCNINYSETFALTEHLNYKIPLLTEVLDKFRGLIHFDIEIKEMGYEDDVVLILKKHLSYDQYYLRSFYDKTLRRIKRIDENIKTGLLLGLEKPKFGFLGRLSELFPLARIMYTKCDFVSPHYRLCILGYVRRMKLIRRPIIIWTVNDPKVIKKLISQSVDGIITDYPTRLIEINNKIKG